MGGAQASLPVTQPWFSLGFPLSAHCSSLWHLPSCFHLLTSTGHTGCSRGSGQGGLYPRGPHCSSQGLLVPFAWRQLVFAPWELVKLSLDLQNSMISPSVASDLPSRAGWVQEAWKGECSCGRGAEMLGNGNHVGSGFLAGLAAWHSPEQLSAKPGQGLSWTISSPSVPPGWQRVPDAGPLWLAQRGGRGQGRQAPNQRQV